MAHAGNRTSEECFIMSRLCRQGVFILVLVMLLAVQEPIMLKSVAANSADDFMTDMMDSAIEIEGQRTRRDKQQNPQPSPAAPNKYIGQAVAGHKQDSSTTQTKYVPACSSQNNNGSINCAQMNELCSADGDGTLMHILTAPAGQVPPQWTPTAGAVCQFPDRPIDTEEEADENPLPTITVEFFRRLPIAPSQLGVEPVPHTLIGAETNVFADPNPQRFDEVVDGHDVAVRAIPTSYTWDYGDGTTLGPTGDPGGPLSGDRIGEATATSHRYARTGDVQVTLTTTYRGEYSFNGTDWIGIDGEANVVSPSVGVSVWRSVVNNFADNCLENPNGAGC
jgi:hypothetical protein